MPCRSSLASISLRPRDRCERSRRPIGASGGGSGRGGETIGAGAGTFGEATGLGAALASVSGGATGGFAARCRLRNGLTCLATLSQSACSSSLRPRLRRGGSGNSGIKLEDRRFIGGIGGGDGGTFREPGRCSGALPAAAPVLQLWLGQLEWPAFASSLPPVASPPAHQFSGPSADRFAETALRFFPTVARPAPAPGGRAPRDRGSSGPA